jgi:hypothetical protein
LATSPENAGWSDPEVTVKLESFASGDNGTGGGGPVTLLASLQPFKKRIASIEKTTVAMMFLSEG